MNEALLSSLVDKVDEQERKIGELKEKADQKRADEEIIQQFTTSLEAVRTDIKKIAFPEKEMRELSERLDTSIELLKRPVEQKIIQQHHVPKIIWITAGLFLVLSLAIAGWYNTSNNLDLYKANDTKYRFLKLEGGTVASRYLRYVDSLYKTDAKMREFVITREEQNQRDFDMLQRARQMENDAKNLKKKVKEGKTFQQDN